MATPNGLFEQGYMTRTEVESVRAAEETAIGLGLCEGTPEWNQFFDGFWAADDTFDDLPALVDDEG
jgi:hypothetical protein